MLVAAPLTHSQMSARKHGNRSGLQIADLTFELDGHLFIRHGFLRTSSVWSIQTFVYIVRFIFGDIEFRRWPVHHRIAELASCHGLRGNKAVILETLVRDPGLIVTVGHSLEEGCRARPHRDLSCSHGNAVRRSSLGIELCAAVVSLAGSRTSLAFQSGMSSTLIGVHVARILFVHFSCPTLSSVITQHFGERRASRFIPLTSLQPV